jgi:hypothetical protein
MGSCTLVLGERGASLIRGKEGRGKEARRLSTAGRDAVARAPHRSAPTVHLKGRDPSSLMRDFADRDADRDAVRKRACARGLFFSCRGPYDAAQAARVILIAG